MNRMSMPSWDRIKAVFAEACELPAEQVPAFLDRVCVTDGTPDAELRREVESLLAARSGKQVATGGAARELAAASTMRSAIITEGAGTIIGPYKLLQLIGEGGFGSVFLAEQTQPVRRRVAVKIIKLGMDTKQVIARFEAERQALALMDHPHIAKVLDGGATPLTERGGGRPYFVMEYVVGDAITAFADAHKLTIRDRLDLFQQVCSAVQHAHTKGIIHRDLKPGNVLVTMVDGKPFAKVIDFGIAKATAGPGGLTDKTLFTEHRQLIGTPEYMSPEQAEGSPDIDTRTDVYALGVLLYELLTGQTPFDGARLRSAAYAEIQRIIKDEEPPSPSQRLSRSLETIAATAAARQMEPDKLRASVHGELDWIVMRALDKERGRRYESANSLADDVRRHLLGEAVVAAQVSKVYRLRKFARRNKGTVALVAVVLVGLAGTTFGFVVADYNARVATTNARAALDSKDAAEWSAYTANLALAQSALDRGGWSEARYWTNQCPEPKRGWEWNFLSQQLQSVELELVGHKGPVTSVRFSLDGTRLATASSDGTARVWSASTGLVVGVFSGDEASVNDVAFSPDGTQLLTASSNGAIRVWDVASQTVRLILAPSLENARTGFFSADGTRILTCDDQAVRIWRTADGKLLSVLDGHSGTTWSVGLSADEKRVVSTGFSKIVRVWDFESARLELELKAHIDWVRTAEFNPSGDRLVTASFDGTARVWDATSGRVISTLVGHSGEVWSAQFSADGTRVLTGSSDGTARIWEAGTGKCLLVLGGHSDGVSSVQFSPDGQLIATASADGSARVWDVASGEILAQLRGHTDQISHGEFSPDGMRYATASYDGSVRLWAVKSLPQILAANSPETLVKTNRWRSSSGYRVRLRCDAVVGSRADRGRSGLTITTPDGTRRIIGGSDKTVRFYEAKDGKPTLPATAESPEGVYREVAVFRMPDAITNLQMTGDGTRLIIHLQDGSARVWDIRDPDERRKDLQAEWAERVPAGAYLDTLWATDTPDDKLCDAVMNDASLTPLRRLVAAEMLEERLEDDRIAAEDAFERLKQAAESEAATTAADPASTTSALRAAAAAADLPPRVRARVIALAAGWEYAKSEAPSIEQVESVAAILAGAESGEMRRREITDEMIRRAVGVRISAHGLASPYTVEAVRKQLNWGATTSEADMEQIRRVARAIEASDLRRSATGLMAYDAAFSLSLYEGKFDEAARLGRLIAECSLEKLPQYIVWGEHVHLELLNGRYIQMGPHLQAWLSTVTSNELRRRASQQRISSLTYRLREGQFLAGIRLGNDERSLVRWLDAFGDPADAESRAATLARSELRMDGALPALRRLTLLHSDESRLQALSVASMVRHRLSTADDATLAAAAEIDGKRDSLTGGRVLDREGHRAAAREALARAKALMQPAADGTPSPWANDEDAKALIAEAEALIGGAP